MLHVNHEARTVALKHYAWYKYSGTLNIKRHVCFSSKRDILSLPKYYPQLSSEPHVTKIGSSSEEPVYLEHEFRTVWISDTSYWEWLKHPESKRRGLSVYCRRLKGLENYVVIKGATAVSICSDPLVIMKQETEYFETGRDGDVRKVALHLWTLIPDTPEVSSEEEDSEVDEAAEAA